MVGGGMVEEEERGWVAYVIQAFLVLPLDRLSFAEYLCIWGHNAVGLGVCLHHLELHTPHASTNQEGIILDRGKSSAYRFFHGSANQ